MTGLVAAWRASYTGGDWLVLAGPTAVIALDPDATLSGPDIERIWSDVVGAVSMDDLVSRLSSVDRSQSPRMLALFWDRAGLRTLVRGGLTLRDVHNGTALAEGDGVVTWREVGLGETTAVVVALPGNTGGGLALPLVVGAVRASSLRIDAAATAAVHSPQISPAPSAVGTDEADPGDDPSAEDTLDSETPADSETPEDVADPDRGEEATEATDMESDFAEELEAPTSRADHPPSVDAERARAEMENADTSLMDPAVLAAHLSGGVPGATAGPLVAAAVCVNRHLNPPYASGCWICGEAVPDQEPRSVPRPVLARLRMPDGSEVALDQPVLIGRAPGDTGQAGEPARLLPVISPGHDISRTHVMVSPVGWQILVTDLGSTNGTTVVTPGPGVDRVSLQAGQPLSVALGTLVEVGDGVAVLIDGAQ